MMRILCALAILALAGIRCAAAPEGGRAAPAAETLTFPGPATYRPLTADELIPLLDAGCCR